jgi:hypothetical protein
MSRTLLCSHLEAGSQSVHDLCRCVHDSLAVSLAACAAPGGASIGVDARAAGTEANQSQRQGALRRWQQLAQGSNSSLLHLCGQQGRGGGDKGVGMCQLQ